MVEKLRPAEAALASQSRSLEITVGDVEYLLVEHPSNFLAASFADDGPTLALIYALTPGTLLTRAALCDFHARVLDRDDVFQTAFRRNIVFSSGSNSDLAHDVAGLLREWGVETRTFVAAAAAPGPYVVQDQKTWQPWRVYHDGSGCFMTALRPGAPVAAVNTETTAETTAEPAPLVALDAAQAGLGGRVVVPSRAYFAPSAQRPLDGARICVKDNIDIAGHKTSLCNLAWTALYPAKTQNAACVQTLIDAGAVVVGKVKLQAMIMREEPLECVEFTAPFNPRADGYQVPSGSSHASAASVASYPWLDFSLGSDTNGSGRKPASYNGCFSIRPSTGVLDTTGVVGFFPPFDMPVFFGRDIAEFANFISVWYGTSPLLLPPRTPLKIKLLYPEDYLPTTNAAQTRVIDTFVAGVEAAFGIQRTPFSLAAKWAAEAPDGPEHTDIAKYLVDAGIFPFYHDQYHNSAAFRNDYQQKFGKPPFVHRALHWQWEAVGKTISQEQRDALWRRSEIYRAWLGSSSVFDVDAAPDVLTVMALPIESGQPSYRDAPVPSYLPLLSGYAALNMSPMMRAPEVTAPIGDIPYMSTVTQREERLPVAVSLIGPPGADLLLVDIVEKGMKAGHIPTQVKTGSLLY
ncbi:hypothetical protein SCUCBS95973_007328 [Sporothrix curviconia]|uniref:Amidase domain-containing protein n=1 Tax=Sporothrix curviconia TaxID=1260050 RepID=A0ABP0CCH4_9PEZI